MSPDETHDGEDLGMHCIWHLGRVPRLQPWIPFPLLNILLTPGFDVTRKISAVTRLILTQIG